MPFKKGKSGNPGGVPKDQRIERGLPLGHKIKLMVFRHAIKKVRLSKQDKIYFQGEHIEGEPGTENLRKTNQRIQLALTRLYHTDVEAYLNVLTKVMPKEMAIDATVSLANWNEIFQYASEVPDSENSNVRKKNNGKRKRVGK